MELEYFPGYSILFFCVGFVFSVMLSASRGLPSLPLRLSFPASLRYNSRDSKDVTYNVVPFHEENIPFFKHVDVHCQFHYFQRKCDSIISQKISDSIAESKKKQKHFSNLVEKSLKIRQRQLQTMAENPPVLFPRVFNSFPPYSNENYVSNAAMKFGYNPVETEIANSAAEEFFETEDNEEEDELSDDEEEVDNEDNDSDDEDIEEIKDEVALQYVFSNWNTLKVYERTFDLLSEHYAHFQSLNNMHKMSVFPQNPPVGKIGFMDFDPVQWRASKQRRWEAIAGITQEELKKVGIDASFRKFPMYPNNIPMIFPLRVETETERCYIPEDMPLDAPKAFMNLVRDRITLRSDAPPPPPPAPEGKTVHIIRDYYLEPSYLESMRKPAEEETRNVILKVKVGDLNLPPLARHRLIAIAGTRYHRKVDVLKIVGNKFQDKKTNKRYAIQILRELLKESLLAVPQYVNVNEESQISLLPPPIRVPEVQLGEENPFTLFRFMPTPF
jgi:hypothetical protein